MAKARSLSEIKLSAPEAASIVDEVLAIIDGLVEASGKPFLKLAWGLIRKWLKPKAVANQLVR